MLSFDTAGRLDQIVQNLAGAGNDLTLSFDFNAAGQIVSRTGSDADFAWTPLAPGTTSYTDNNLNQYTNVGGTAQAHDARGNLTTGSFGYDILNRLTSGPSSATFSYDPASRLYQTVGGGVTTRFLYDGAQAIAEYNASNVLQRRFIPGPSLDEPIVWYEGSGTTDRRWFVSDERGSVIAVTNSSGNATTINRYDEYGVPHASNAGRFQYTGQMWLPEAARYHYRARVYAPTTGRFQQTDPILHAGGMNLYAYVGNDPVNARDPWGLQQEECYSCVDVDGVTGGTQQGGFFGLINVSPFNLPTNERGIGADECQDVVGGGPPVCGVNVGPPRPRGRRGGGSGRGQPMHPALDPLQIDVCDMAPEDRPAGYADFNLVAATGRFLAGTGGAMIDRQSGDYYFYLGAGVSFSGPGISAAGTSSTNARPTQGWNVAVQGSFSFVVGSIGYSWGTNPGGFSESGVGTPGYSATAFYSWRAGNLCENGGPE